MNLEKLFKKQRELDECILDRFPELRNEDLLGKKILALQVELGELAQNWRGFKFWSEDQRSRIEKEIKCFSCQGTGDENYETVQEDAEGQGGHTYVDCVDCDTTGVSEVTNPLLEEYVDCLHFILSIGLELGFERLDFASSREEYSTHNITFKAENITKQFNNIFHFTVKFEEESLSDEFVSVVLSFVVIGEMLGFTWEQIESAYYDKNAINHSRQENGY